MNTAAIRRSQAQRAARFKRRTGYALLPAASHGRDGCDFRIRDTYHPALTDYEALDVVTMNATWFVARTDNPAPFLAGLEKRAGFQLPDKGERGPKGQRGLAGPSGA